MEKVGVLFDLDGVLIDSEGLYTEFWEDIEKYIPPELIILPMLLKVMHYLKYSTPILTNPFIKTS